MEKMLFFKGRQVYFSIQMFKLFYGNILNE